MEKDELCRVGTITPCLGTIKVRFRLTGRKYDHYGPGRCLAIRHYIDSILSIFSFLGKAMDVGIGIFLMKVYDSTYCCYHCQIPVPVQTALGTLQHNIILNWITCATVAMQFGAAAGKSDKNIEGCD
jgi:hypothetical protein